MNLDLYFSAGVDFEVIFENQVFNISKDTDSIRISYDPEFDKIFKLRLRSDNPRITEQPVVVNKIVFDDFWELCGNKIARGQNIYSEHYIEFANSKNITVDYSVVDNHILFFTGELIFSFSHPIHEYLDQAFY